MNLERFLLFLLLLIRYTASAQDGLSVNGTNASLFVPAGNFISVAGAFNNVKCDPATYVRFQGSLYLAGDLVNNDILRFSPSSSLTTKQCRIIFFNAVSQLTGSVSPLFWEVELDVGLGKSLNVYNDVYCLDTLNFKSGLLYLHGRKWHLQDPVGAPSVFNRPWIKGERNGSQFISGSIVDTGKVIYNTIYTSSLNLEAGNIGIRINGLVNSGSPVTIIRCLKNQVNCGKAGIAKYFDIYSPGHKLVNNSLEFRYHLNDIANYPFNYLSGSNLRAYVSPLNDQDWTPFSSAYNLMALSINNQNALMNINLSDLRNPNMLADSNAFRITLADYDCANPPISQLPSDTAHICAGDSLLLDLGNASNISNSQLRYQWTTIPALYTRTLQVKPTANYQKFKAQLMDVRGCTTLDSIIIAPAAPYPTIKYFNHLNACLGDSILVKDTVTLSSGTYTNSYFFSDTATISTNANLFKKKFFNSGTYAMQLNAISNYGCISTSNQTNIIVYNLPTAAFTHSLYCLNRQSQFTDQSTSNDTLMPLSAFKWYFDSSNLNFSNLKNPTHSYTISGSYAVKEIVATPFGCRDSVIQNITIYPDNLASFTKNNACDGDTVSFFNTSICNTGSCKILWNFGDSTSDSIQIVKKVYGAQGFYQASLKITAPVGCPDSTSIPIFIHPNPIAVIASNTISNCPNEVFYLSNNSSLSIGTITSSIWQVSAQSTINTWNSTYQFSSSGNYIVNLTVGSDSSCFNSSALTLSVHPSPQVLLLTSNVCEGNISTFSSPFQNPNWTYTFDPGNASSSLTNSINTFQFQFTQAGTYSPTLYVANNFGCTDTSTSLHQVLIAPTSPFSGTIASCGDSYILNALNSGSSFFWAPNNLTTQTISSTNSGSFQVIVTNPNTCSITSSVYLKLNTPVSPDIGSDTVVCGNTILNAGYPGSSFFWNSGQTTQQINVVSSGTYAVQITDQNGCQGSDTTTIVIKPLPTLNLGPDQNICKPPLGLLIQAIGSAGNYSWSNGVTGISNTITNSGYYWAKITAANGCVQIDTIQITLRPKPIVNLGADQSACDKIILDAQNQGMDFMWSTGSTAQTNTITQTSLVWVNVQNVQSGCNTADTINLTVYKKPVINLGGDTSICENQKIILNPTNLSGDFLWTNGATTKTLAVLQPGLYGLKVTGDGACSSTEFININFLTAPHAEIGSYLRYLCGSNALQLTLQSSDNFQWTKNNEIVSTNSFVNITTPGIYKVTVSNNNCKDLDSALVIATNNTVLANFLASTVDTVNRAVKFVNLSGPNQIYNKWDFGDGITNGDLNPEHTWVSPQDFLVSLEVSNGFCSDKMSKPLSILFKGSNTPLKINKGLAIEALLCYPNPANDHLNYYVELNHAADLSISISDLCGKVIHSETYLETDFQRENISLLNWSNGMYFIEFRANGAHGIIKQTKKFTIEQ